MGTALGMALFAIPAVMLGRSQSSLIYLMLLAVLWAPAFAWPSDRTPRPSFDAVLDDLRRYFRAALQSTLLILPFYLMGFYVFSA